MGTNCAPLVADLCLFCYVRDFMLTIFDHNQTVLKHLTLLFKITRILNIDKPYFEQMVSQIYTTELEIYKGSYITAPLVADIEDLT